MTETLFSPYWYRAAHLHPRLVSNASITRQSFRDEQWYVISSQTTGRQFRVNNLGYQIVGRLDGRMSVQEIWDVLVRTQGNDAPSQHEVLSILSDLTTAGMIQSETTPDLGGIFDAAERRRKRNSAGKLNPLAFKVPLFDPTALLDFLMPLTRWLFNGWVLIAWALSVSAAALLSGMHWSELHAFAALHLFEPRNLLLTWLCYPVIKALHEFGHALAIRRWQGEVHEVGAMLFLVMPVPYIDASSASTFPEKHRRILVSAMGVIVETAIASAALLVWLGANDGWLRDAAFSCLMIGGASTILVNANPLMRYDGYYVLADWLEIPGLAAHSEAYLRYLGERYLLGNKTLFSRTDTAIPRIWLFLYGIGALIYRIALLAGMVIWLSAKILMAGLALALYLAVKYIVISLWRLLNLIFLSPRLERVRLRAATSLALLAAATAGAVFIVPMPYTTRTQGIVWLPDTASLRNETEGFVQKVLVRDGEHVHAGQALLVMENSDLLAEQQQIDSQIASQEIDFQAAMLDKPAEAIAIDEGLEKLRAQREDLDTRITQLTLKSPLDGQLALPHTEDLPGQFFARGALVAHVVAPQMITVRAVLSQADIDLLRQTPERIEVRIAEERDRTLLGHLGNETPAATNQLPSAILGESGGGPIATDPSDRDGLRSIDSFFVVDVNVIGKPLARIGSRVWLHIEHRPATLAQQWARSIRQVFVKQFGASNTAFLL
ncbi:MAG TPA: biotin/lipoyl-binding protein [Rhodocyclaceae bacterium]|nr:biotin/lipoyl-binding protein [Rhodocyclaceae bacterium]